MKSLTALLFSAASLLAQSNQPTVSNARFETQPYAGDLKRQVSSPLPRWSGYMIKTRQGDHQSCCWGDGRQQGCGLEGNHSTITGATSKSPIPLEGTDKSAVLFRTDAGAVTKIRSFSLDCPLDAGGLSFVWIDRVPASASLAFLNDLIQHNQDNHVMDGAVLAVAQHDTPDADTLLAKLTEPSQPEKVREKAIFWIGAARGPSGTTILEKVLATDPNDKIRDKAVFALSIGKTPAALIAIENAAKNDKSPHVRSQALFWLAQAAGNRAASSIMNAIENDPDTQVKEKAVFALSQLPKDEGIPKLIQVASDQRNPEVKKKAFFWLGQSGDPRALEFIEKVLQK